MKHIISVVVLIIITTLVMGILFSAILLPEQASAEGVIIDWLLGVHLQLIAFLFSFVMVFMVYSAIVFRRREGDDGDGAYIHGNTPLEIVWTILPLAVVLYLGYIGTITLNQVTAKVEDELVVEVSGLQWSWRFDYPEAGVSSTVLNLPIDRTVLLKLTSGDVIHSFWVPEFRVKQDAVPGAVKELRLTPTKSGSYVLRCAELCGLNHAYMLAEVNVLSTEEFDNWLTEQGGQVSDSPIERGARVAELNGCKACHSVDGIAGIGPSWLGVYGQQEALNDGTTVLVDEDYLLKSIIDPNVQIVEGYQPNLMPPTFEQLLSEEEIDDLIAYIKSLSE